MSLTHPTQIALIDVHSYSETETIKLVVGKKKRRFYVHHGLLAKIKFFRACLDSGFHEGESRTIMLEEDDPDAVEALIKWLYLEKVCDLVEDEEDCLATRHAFGDKICCEAYCNDLMDARRLFDRPRNRFQNFAGLNGVYQVGLRNTPYARYALKTTVHQMLAHSASFPSKLRQKAFQEIKTPDILEDMVNEVIEYQKQPYHYPHSHEGCQFHNHQQGIACSAVTK